jgi:hypothetical protein
VKFKFSYFLQIKKHKTNNFFSSTTQSTTTRQSTQATLKIKCQEYSDDGDCLGSLENDDSVGLRCMFCSNCPIGYKEDRNNKCRKKLY